MGIRESVRRIPPVYAAVAAAICVLVAVYMIHRQVRKPDAELGAAAVLKCTDAKCARVEHVTLQWVLKNATVDDVSRSYPAAKCPACSQRTLAYAWECPRDRTVFFRSVSNEPGAKDSPRATGDYHGALCPSCGYDPGAEERKKLAESFRKAGQ